MRNARNEKISPYLPVALLAAAFAALLLSGCSTLDVGAGKFDTVVVDAGHGGYDRGARAISGLPEKRLVYDTARRLARILRSKGFHVIETRKRKTFIPLSKRTSISNRTHDSIFVSIHYNWSSRRAARGIEIYYYTRRSRRLAANILDQVLHAYPTKNRGVKRNDFYVLRKNKRPAVLCELGFLSNRKDNRYAQSWYYRQRLAERIADGIVAEHRGKSP